MNATPEQLWQRFQKHYTEFPTLGLALDLSRMNFGDDFLPAMQPRLAKAFAAMAELERGCIAGRKSSPKFIRLKSSARPRLGNSV